MADYMWPAPEPERWVFTRAGHVHLDTRYIEWMSLRRKLWCRLCGKCVTSGHLDSDRHALRVQYFLAQQEAQARTRLTQDTTDPGVEAAANS